MKTGKEISVLVTGVGGGGLGIELIKSLQMAEQKYKIVATDMSDKSIGLFKTSYRYLVPPANSPKYIDKVLDICKNEKIEIIIPGSEPETEKISKERKIFEDNKIIVLTNPHNIIKRCQDKFEIIKFLEKKGIKTPRTILYKNKKDLDTEIIFPQIIKPRFGSGSRNIFIANNQNELEFFTDYLIKYNSQPIIQDYIPNNNEEFTIGVIYSNEGKLVISIAMKRILEGGLSVRQSLEHPKSKNKIIISTGFSQGIFENFKEIRNQGEKIAEILEIDGPANIQCRNTKNGIIPFEVNPRFSGTTTARALVGVNEPDILCRYKLFGEIPKKIQIKNRIVRREINEKIITLKELKKVKLL